MALSSFGTKIEKIGTVSYLMLFLERFVLVDQVEEVEVREEKGEERTNGRIRESLMEKKGKRLSEEKN